MRSSGRGRLPTWVVSIRSVLFVIEECSPFPIDRPAAGAHRPADSTVSRGALQVEVFVDESGPLDQGGEFGPGDVAVDRCQTGGGGETAVDARHHPRGTDDGGVPQEPFGDE